LPVEIASGAPNETPIVNVPLLIAGLPVKSE
jgi:hypothetical protein